MLQGGISVKARKIRKYTAFMPDNIDDHQGEIVVSKKSPDPITASNKSPEKAGNSPEISGQKHIEKCK